MAKRRPKVCYRMGRGRRKTKQEEAAARNALWAEFSPEAKIAEIDRRLGEGVGAKRQRARIAKELKAAKR